MLLGEPLLELAVEWRYFVQRLLCLWLRYDTEISSYLNNLYLDYLSMSSLNDKTYSTRLEREYLPRV
jgi:hypothetical protein